MGRCFGDFAQLFILAMPDTTSETAASGDAEAQAQAQEPTARSVVLEGFGGPKMMKITNRPEMEPTDCDVLIQVKAW